MACQAVMGMVKSNSSVPTRRSSAHSRMPDRRDQEQVEPRMPDEEGAVQAGLAALKKAARHEGEEARQQQEDDDENIGDRATKNNRPTPAW